MSITIKTMTNSIWSNTWADPQPLTAIYLAACWHAKQEDHHQSYEDSQELVSQMAKKLSEMKPYEVRRLFSTKQYQTFCSALEVLIENKEVIHSLENDTLQTRFEF